MSMCDFKDNISTMEYLKDIFFELGNPKKPLKLETI